MGYLRLAAIAVWAACSAQADGNVPLKGQQLFGTYCWQCHGRDGTGSGPMAEMLAIAPPDLTRLSRRNGGTFPTQAVAIKIDGRSPVLAHGGEMPLFGQAFDTGRPVTLHLEGGEHMIVGQPLADIIAYLASLQSATK